MKTHERRSAIVPDSRLASTLSQGVLHGISKIIVSGALGFVALHDTAKAQTTSFLDSTLSLANYTTSSATTIQTITSSNILSDGNPGTALQVTFQVPATASYSQVNFTANLFAYDPATKGSLATIDFGADFYITVTNGIGLGVNGLSFLILQGGNLYSHFSSLSPTQGLYQRAVGTQLTSSAFNLISNPATGGQDPTMHPNFATGAMSFGFTAGWRTPAGFPALSVVERFDNFSVSLSPVPEVSTNALLAFGLVAILGINRCRVRPSNR